MNNSYGPLISALPLSLSDRMATAPSIEGTEGGKVEGAYTENSHPRRADQNVGGPTDTSTSHTEMFAHPASRESQQVVWIPTDPLGLGEAEAAACQAQGVKVSMDGAQMNGKGHVDVDRPPPGENVGASTF